MSERYGDHGSAVGAIQRRLNCANPTRLPRLTVDDDFGAMTMARLMEWQKIVRLRDDGVAGPSTHPRLDRLPETCTSAASPSGRCILANLFDRRADVFADGRRLRRLSPILGGRPSAPSDLGVFRVHSCDEDHTSSQFPSPTPNMRYAVFYNRGEAFHQGNTSVLSHGCVHCTASDGGWLFNWVLGHARGRSRSERERQCRTADVMVIVVGPR